MQAYINRKSKRKRKKDEEKPDEKMKCHIGKKQNTDELEPNISLTFKVNTIERSLDTMYIHPT